MKKSLKILSALAFLSIAVGCNKDKPSDSESVKPSITDSLQPSQNSSPSEVQSLNLMGNLKDGGDGIYTITGDAEKTVTYTKTESSSWASVVAETTGLDLSKAIGLRFTIKGQGKVLIKIQSDNGAAEINLKLTSAASSYAWSLADENAKAAMAGNGVKVYVFGLPGATSGSGEFTFANLEFITEFADSDYVITTGYTNESKTVSQYDGVSATFDVNQTWTENDANTYDVSYENGVTTVNYSVISYQFMVSQIQGSAHGKFTYITFKVKGTAGEKFLAKVENSTGQIAAKEALFTLTGGDDIFTLDISTYSENERGLINKVLFFAAPGTAEKATGTMVLSGVYFTTEWEGQNKQEIVYPTNEYNGKDNQFGCNNYWHDNGDGCYEVVGTEAPFEIKYSNVGEWSTVKTQVSGLLGNFATLKFGVEVEKDKEIMIKVAGIEERIIGTGAYDDTHSIDLSSLSVEDRNNIKEVLIFAEPGVAGGTGSFKIHWMSFNDYTAQEVNSVTYEGYGRYVNVQASNFESLDKGVYSVNTNKIAFTKEAGQEWSCAVATLEGNFGDFTALDYALTIPEGHSVLLKVEGTDSVAKEVTIEGTGQMVQDSLDLSTIDTSKLTKVVLFGDPNVAPSTSEVQINTLRFAKIKGTMANQDGNVDMTAGKMFDLGDNKYDITHNENGTYTVTTKEGKGEWSSFALRVAAPSGYTKATLTVTGAQADTLLFKSENDLGGGAAEATITNLGEHVQITLDLTNTLSTNPDTILFLFFANPGATTIPSTITIESITFSK